MTADKIVEATVSRMADCPNPWCTFGGSALPAKGESGWRIICGCGVSTFARPTEQEARDLWNNASRMEVILDWFKWLPRGAREKLSLYHLHTLFKRLRTGQPKQEPSRGL